MTRIAIIEGEGGPTDFDIEMLQDIFGEIEIVGDYEDVYKYPKKLRKLNIDNPEYIFVNTTGLYEIEILTVKLEFLKTNYIPTNVIYGIAEQTEYVFSDLYKVYSKLGTKFWKIGLDKLIEIVE